MFSLQLPVSLCLFPLLLQIAPILRNAQHFSLTCFFVCSRKLQGAMIQAAKPDHSAKSTWMIALQVHQLVNLLLYSYI